MFRLEDRHLFLIRNTVRGLLWFVMIVLVFLLVRRLLPDDYQTLLEPVWENSVLIYIIFFASEVIFGTIPPELFMIWTLRTGNWAGYVLIIASFFLISYLAGIIGYFLGRVLRGTAIYRKLSQGYFKKYEKYIYNYSALLITVAATTPVPYSATCIIVGSVEYPFRRFLLYALTRVVRFSVYAWFVWESNVMLHLTG